MSRIVSFGEALIDFHAQSASGTEPTPVFVPHPGGAPANVAVAVARLGGEVAFAGMLGADMFGDMLQQALEAAGVDMHLVRRTDRANTALAFISLDGDGERSFSFYRPPSADLLFREDDFDADAWSGAAIFHSGSCTLTERDIAATTLVGMRRARDAGALVSFDMNLRPVLWPRDEDPAPRLWLALTSADVVKLSREEMAFVAGSMGSDDAAIAQLWRGHARLLVVTDGPRPLHWYTRGASGSLAAFQVQALDSTGAGDAFTGGLLQGLAEQDVRADALDALFADAPRRDALLRRAMACGALAATRVGSFAAMPEGDTVDRFLEMQA